MRIHTVIMFKVSGEIVKRFCKTFTDAIQAKQYACNTSAKENLWYDIVSDTVQIV